MMDLSTATALLPGLVIGLTLHEFAHAWSASLLGDDFARRQGRVSLNPLRHLSPLGTLAILILPFGWGKPVGVNLHNFRHPKRDYLITSLAGPLANVAVVLACIGLMQLTRHTYAQGPRGVPYLRLAHVGLTLVAMINIVLAVLNLIPIPPLDGSKIWPCLIPGLKPGAKTKTTWLFVGLLVALMYTGTLDPAIRFVTRGTLTMLPTSDERRYRDQMGIAWEQNHAHQFSESVRSFTRALEINPFSDECFYGRSLARLCQRHYPEALDDVNRAIELNGSRPDLYECRARALSVLGRDAEADADMDRAVSLRAAHAPRSQPASAPASTPAGRRPTSSPESPPH